MTDTHIQSSEHSIPGPVLLLLGILQFAASFLLMFPAAIMTVFPLTAALGRALMKPVGAMAFNGGAKIGEGLVETARLIGRAFGTAAQVGQTKLAEHRAAQEPTPDSHD